MDYKLLGSVAKSIDGSLRNIATELKTLSEQNELKISFGNKQSRRIEALLAELIFLSGLPQKTQVERDRSGQIISSTRSIDDEVL